VCWCKLDSSGPTCNNEPWSCILCSDRKLTVLPNKLRRCSFLVWLGWLPGSIVPGLSWKVDRLTGQEIPCLLWYPKFITALNPPTETYFQTVGTRTHHHSLYSCIQDFSQKFRRKADT
jgi:hypothetical protein